MNYDISKQEKQKVVNLHGITGPLIENRFHTSKILRNLNLLKELGVIFILVPL